MIQNYLLVAWKVLLRRRFFTFISLFGISITLAVLMVVAAILDQVFVPQAPETQLDRMLGVYAATMSSPDGSTTYTSPAGYGLLDRYVRTLPGVEMVSVYSSLMSHTVYNNGRKVTLRVKRTDGVFWRMLDFTFVEGRHYTAAEDSSGLPVAVITDAVRSELFGGAQAVGRTITLNGRVFRVIGVVAAVPFFRSISYADVWVPVGALLAPDDRQQLLGNYSAVILARSTDDLDRLKAAYQAQLRTVEFPDPARLNSIESQAETFAETVARDMIGDRTVEKPLRLFTLLVSLFAVLFMLLPAVNLVNINVSRIMERASEIGVRKSFGASTGTLVVQFLVENLFLVLIGGALGLLLALLVLQWIASTELLPHAQFGLNIRLFGYALVATCFFGLVSGVYPAWKMSRLQPVEALKGGVSL